MTNNQAESVRQHYETVEGNAARVSKVIELLDKLGNGPLTTMQLAPLDQFHSRGLAGTKELAELAGIQPGIKIFDAGSGIGGPARYLAETYGCSVTGVDLTPSFVELAKLLTERTGLTDRVSFEVGNLLALPFPDDQFDLVWTQHVVMNIRDRKQVYGEFKRVLKPGGKLVFHDVFASDDKQALLFPVPWAESSETSFLLTKAETIEALKRAGFTAGTWNDDTEKTQAALAAQSQAAPPSPDNLTLLTLLGPRIAGMAANAAQNAREGRTRVAMAICEATN